MNTMKKNMIGKPAMQLGKYGRFITSDRMITGVVVLVGSPSILGIADQLSSRFPALRGNLTLALLIVAIVLFVIAGALSGILSSVVLGLSISAFANALLTVNSVSSAVGRITNRTRSG